MKLLVMGAGYVGMALLDNPQSPSHEVYITTTRPERMQALAPYGKQVTLLRPGEGQGLNGLVAACDAAVILVAPHPPQTYEETYLGTAKMISSALAGRTKPFHLIYTSSTSVCEGAPSGWVTEDTPLHPTSKNANILLETEHLYLQSKATTCILRLGGIYGPNRELVERAKRFSGKEFPGAPDAPTNHIHVEDIVGAINFCLTHAITGVYHLANDDHPTRRTLYSGLCASLGLPPPTWNPALSQGGYKVSNNKIKGVGFAFKHPHLNVT